MVIIMLKMSVDKVYTTELIDHWTITPLSKDSKFCQSWPILPRDPMERGKPRLNWTSVLVGASNNQSNGKPKKMPNSTRMRKRITTPIGVRVSVFSCWRRKRERRRRERVCKIIKTPFGSLIWTHIGTEETGQANYQDSSSQSNRNHQQRHHRRRAKIA